MLSEERHCCYIWNPCLASQLLFFLPFLIPCSPPSSFAPMPRRRLSFWPVVVMRWGVIVTRRGAAAGILACVVCLYLPTEALLYFLLYIYCTLQYPMRTCTLGSHLPRNLPAKGMIKNNKEHSRHEDVTHESHALVSTGMVEGM